MPPSISELLLALLAIFVPLLLACALVFLPDVLKKRKKPGNR